jgi:hypothetical protein
MRTQYAWMAHLRHTLPPDSGVTLKILSDRIGHSDLSVTLQVYGHHSTGHDRRCRRGESPSSLLFHAHQVQPALFVALTGLSGCPVCRPNVHPQLPGLQQSAS